MNGDSLFTPKKNIYTVKYGTRKDPGSFEGLAGAHLGLRMLFTFPARHLRPPLPKGISQASRLGP